MPIESSKTQLELTSFERNNRFETVLGVTSLSKRPLSSLVKDRKSIDREPRPRNITEEFWNETLQYLHSKLNHYDQLCLEIIAHFELVEIIEGICLFHNYEIPPPEISDTIKPNDFDELYGDLVPWHVIYGKANIMAFSNLYYKKSIEECIQEIQKAQSDVLLPKDEDEIEQYERLTALVTGFENQIKTLQKKATKFTDLERRDWYRLRAEAIRETVYEQINYILKHFMPSLADLFKQETGWVYA